MKFHPGQILQDIVQVEYYNDPKRAFKCLNLSHFPSFENAYNLTAHLTDGVIGALEKEKFGSKQFWNFLSINHDTIPKSTSKGSVAALVLWCLVRSYKDRSDFNRLFYPNFYGSHIDAMMYSMRHITKDFIYELEKNGFFTVELWNFWKAVSLSEYGYRLGTKLVSKHNKRKIIPPHAKEDIWNLRNEGKTIREIVKISGLSKTSIERILRTKRENNQMKSSEHSAQIPADDVDAIEKIMIETGVIRIDMRRKAWDSLCHYIVTSQWKDESKPNFNRVKDNIFEFLSGTNHLNEEAAKFLCDETIVGFSAEEWMALSKANINKEMVVV